MAKGYGAAVYCYVTVIPSRMSSAMFWRATLLEAAVSDDDTPILPSRISPRTQQEPITEIRVPLDLREAEKDRNEQLVHRRSPSGIFLSGLTDYMHEFCEDRRGVHSIFRAVTTTEDQSCSTVSVDTNTA